MGQCGKVILYTTREPDDPRAQLAQLLAISGDKVSWVSRTRGVDRRWRLARNAFAREEGSDDFPAMSVAEVPALYVPKRRLLINVSGGPMMDQIHTACLERIPVDVRGEFSPWNLDIWYGSHDLFESAVEWNYIARAFCSVALFGWGSPSNWPKYREMVFQVPEIIEAKQHFETVLGPLETCAIWSV